MKKPQQRVPEYLFDRHGNKVYPPRADQLSTRWTIDCGIYQELNERWTLRTTDNPPVLLTGIWDQ